MDIQKYEAFLKTVELGSITKTAEALGYSQSGISRMIQEGRMDCGLGVSLLPRLVLKRIPHAVVQKETLPACHRDIVFALRKTAAAPLSVKRFLEYLPCR